MEKNNRKKTMLQIFGIKSRYLGNNRIKWGKTWKTFNTVTSLQGFPKKGIYDAEAEIL